VGNSGNGWRPEPHGGSASPGWGHEQAKQSRSGLGPPLNCPSARSFHRQSGRPGGVGLHALAGRTPTTALDARIRPTGTDMNALDDLRRQVAIADSLLELGVLLYFSGLAAEDSSAIVHKAHVADVNNEYAVLFPPGFDADTKIDAASAAAQWVEEVRSLAVRSTGQFRPGSEAWTLRQLLSDLAARELKVEWWGAADSEEGGDERRRWGRPRSVHWVGIVYAPTGAVCEAGVGSTPIHAASSAASRLGVRSW
jgi:hypothetical protein